MEWSAKFAQIRDGPTQICHILDVCVCGLWPFAGQLRTLHTCRAEIIGAKVAGFNALSISIDIGPRSTGSARAANAHMGQSTPCANAQDAGAHILCETQFSDRALHLSRRSERQFVRRRTGTHIEWGLSHACVNRGIYEWLERVSA